MSIKKIHLRKLLKAFALPENKLTSMLRQDIRLEISKENGTNEGGGDFHGPFWSDAKDFALNGADLPLNTEARIQSNRARKRLYPELLSGFMNWWNNKRRWRNEDIEPYTTNIKAQFEIEGVGGVVKVENFLGISIGDNLNRLIYPYFAETPELTEQNARMGLWLLSVAFPKNNIEDFRILDVLRAKTYSIEDCPLSGTEQRDFTYRYRQIVDRWQELRHEY